MSHSSSSSSRITSGRSKGIPTKCWCGESIVTYTSMTKENPGRRFYRCALALQRKKEQHLFHWIDDALVEEIEIVNMKHKRLQEDVNDMRRSLMELTEHQKTEMEKLELEMKQNGKELIEKELNVAKGNMEKIGRDTAYSSLKIVGVVFVVLVTLIWFYGRFVSGF